MMLDKTPTIDETFARLNSSDFQAKFYLSNKIKNMADSEVHRC